MSVLTSNKQPASKYDLTGQTLQKATKEPAKEYVIEFENVSRQYRLHHEARLTLQDRVVNLFNKKTNYEDFWALKNVSFKLEKGKTLGIIGKNGAGKSTLLKLATRILEPSSGTIRVNGRVSAMLELGTGFHPELSARDNIYLNGAFYGFNRKEMDKRYERIVDFSELGKFIDTPVKHYSSGMYMRLGFAVAITVSPDILIIDEVLAVGDAAFGRKCHQAIEDLKRDSKAMLFVSHSAGEVSRFCDEVIYLSKGEIVAQGKPGDVLDEYMMDSMGPSYFTSTMRAQPDKAPAETKKPVPVEKQTLPAKPKAATVATAATPLVLADKPNRPQSKKPYQVSLGVLHRHLHTTWQFNLRNTQPEETDKKTATTQHFITVLNIHDSPLNFELTGYKQSGSLFDRSVGGMRQVSMGHYEVKARQIAILKLEEGAILRTGLLNLEATQPVAAELIEYNPTHYLEQARQTLQPQNQLGVNWFFPFCDIREDNECCFEVFNPSDETIPVFINLYRDWAGPVEQVRSFLCTPHSQTWLDLKEELVGGEGERQHGERFYGGVHFYTAEDSKIISVKRYSLQTTSPAYHLTDH